MKHKNEGIISIEGTIAIVFFTFAMLFFYAFFYITLARNTISHALLQTGQSMALDAYESSKFTGDKYAEIGSANNLAQLINNWTGFAGGKNGYVDDSRWYEGTQEQLAQVISVRFSSYLAGSKNSANEQLKALGIEKGIEGIDFSNSYVSGGDLYVIATYEIEPWMNFFRLKPMKVTLETCNKLWGASSAKTIKPTETTESTGGGGGGLR